MSRRNLIAGYTASAVARLDGAPVSELEQEALIFDIADHVLAALGVDAYPDVSVASSAQLALEDAVLEEIADELDAQLASR